MHTHTYIHNLFQQVTKSAGPALTTYKYPKVKKEGVYTWRIIDTMAFQAVRGYKQQTTVVKIITGFSEQEEPWLLNIAASNPNYRQFLPEKGSKKTGYTVFATRWHLVAVTTNWKIV